MRIPFINHFGFSPPHSRYFVQLTSNLHQAMCNTYYFMNFHIVKKSMAVDVQHTSTTQRIQCNHEDNCSTQNSTCKAKINVKSAHLNSNAPYHTHQWYNLRHNLHEATCSTAPTKMSSPWLPKHIHWTWQSTSVYCASWPFFERDPGDALALRFTSAAHLRHNLLLLLPLPLMLLCVNMPLYRISMKRNQIFWAYLEERSFDSCSRHKWMFNNAGDYVTLTSLTP